LDKIWDGVPWLVVKGAREIPTKFLACELAEIEEHFLLGEAPGLAGATASCDALSLAREGFPVGRCGRLLFGMVFS